MYLLGDALGGLIAYEMLARQAAANVGSALGSGGSGHHLRVSRNPSSVSTHSESVSRAIPENEVVDDCQQEAGPDDYLYVSQSLMRVRNDLNDKGA